jgi:hypothetical protein
MHKGFITSALLTLATAGSAIFGGVALAGGEHAGSGKGGKATNDCLNVGVDLLAGIGVAGQGVANGASCSASANGTGGGAY